MADDVKWTEGPNRFAVRKTAYGRAAFEVLQIVKVTAATHSVLSRSWVSDQWDRRPSRVKGLPDYPAQGLSGAQADALADVANEEWVALTPAVDAAKTALSEAIDARRVGALAALDRARGASND